MKLNEIEIDFLNIFYDVKYQLLDSGPGAGKGKETYSILFFE